MTYNFKNLSHIDFEDLARDLVGAELGKAFEGFAPGPDGGVDGRHCCGEGNIILQAKHLEGSSFSKLCSTMKRERKKLEKLKCDRYVLVTSRPLTTKNKGTLAEIIGPSLLSESDIIGATDLQGSLRRHPSVAKSHIKLWLSEAVVLERVLNAASHTRSEFTQDEIEAKLRVYVRNQSFDAALDILEEHHATIIHGPPGVGKTTLAEMLVYAHLAEGWELITLRDLESAFSRIDSSRKQVFYFDDFLGSISLDKISLAKHDSDFVRFLNRMKKSPNARFILTTRSYLLEEAQQYSDHLSNKMVSWSKHFLDVGHYTRRVRAEILYNHLYHSGLRVSYIENLISGGPIKDIVDHEHYNPRIIEWMTTSFDETLMDGRAYRDAFLGILNDPSKLWDKAFKKCIPIKCQHLLIALFLAGDRSATLDELESTYSAIRAPLSIFYGDERAPQEFEESLKIIEGSFISIFDRLVRPINPSVRDYLKSYISNEELLGVLAEANLGSRSMAILWQLVVDSNLGGEATAKLALKFTENARRLLRLPTMRAKQGSNGMIYQRVGLSNSDRILLLLNLSLASGSPEFSEMASKLVANPVDGFSCWADGDGIITALDRLREEGEYGTLENRAGILAMLEVKFRSLLAAGQPISELRSLFHAVECYPDLNREIVDELKAAIEAEIEAAEEIISQLDCTSALEEDWECYRDLAPVVGLPDSRLDEIEEATKARQDELFEPEEEYEGPSGFSKSAAEARLSDHDLDGMFASLLQ